LLDQEFVVRGPNIAPTECARSTDESNVGATNSVIGILTNFGMRRLQKFHDFSGSGRGIRKWVEPRMERKEKHENRRSRGDIHVVQMARPGLLDRPLVVIVSLESNDRSI
jgi:hypothetical protein